MESNLNIKSSTIFEEVAEENYYYEGEFKL